MYLVFNSLWGLLGISRESLKLMCHSKTFKNSSIKKFTPDWLWPVAVTFKFFFFFRTLLLFFLIFCCSFYFWLLSTFWFFWKTHSKFDHYILLLLDFLSPCRCVCVFPKLCVLIHLRVWVDVVTLISAYFSMYFLGTRNTTINNVK